MLETATSHARRRRQKRSIPTFVIEALDEVGSGFRANGAERLIFDKAAIRRMRRLPNGDDRLKAVQRWLGVYAVVGDDGRLVTIAHRQRRMKRC